MTWLNTKRISVFTQVPYAGNPAWIILGADAQTEEGKLIKLARELNPLSDTTFVFPGRDDADTHLRFFSQSEEIRFSGHGTIAAYIALENEGALKLTEPITTLRQRTQAGIQPIELRVENKKVTRITVSLPAPRVISMQLEIKTISNFLGIPPVDITDTSMPVKAVESGLVEIAVPVRSIRTLLEMEPNFQLMKNYCERFGITGILAFSMETREKSSNVHMRHFAPAVGINEDPASGGAAACLGYYLVEAGIIPAEEMTRIVVEQGYSMQRPGTIYVHVYTVKREIMHVSFGGQGIITFEGKIMLP